MRPLGILVLLIINGLLNFYIGWSACLDYHKFNVSNDQDEK